MQNTESQELKYSYRNGHVILLPDIKSFSLLFTVKVGKMDLFARNKDSALNEIYKHFKYVEAENKMHCSIDNCAEILSGVIITNLRRHIKRKHNSVFLTLEPPKTYKRIDKPWKNSSGLIKSLRMSCVELLTINGRPFLHIMDSGLRKILRIVSELASDNENIGEIDLSVINSVTVLEDIAKTSEIIVDIISDEVKNKMISLMVDLVSKRGRSILGMNIQFINADTNEITIRCIGMVRLNRSHTGRYLSDLVTQKLMVYNIKTEQIYSMTTDNGANVIKCNEIIRNEFEAATNLPQAIDLLDTTEFNDAVVDAFTDTALFSEASGDVSPERSEQHPRPGEDDLTDDHSDHLLTIFTDEYVSETNSSFQLINGNLCGAHSLQLAVNNAIALWDKRTGLLTKCRSVTDKLRGQNLRDEMNNRKLLLPRPDCSTRWNSTYLMVVNIY